MSSPNDQKKLQVFLCHASADKPAVRQLYKRLVGLNWVKPWLDKENLLPGQNWREEIPKAVRASHVVLVCLSHHSITAEGYVQKEIADALDVAKEKPENTIYLVPLRLEECEPPTRLANLHWVDYFEEDGFEYLLRSLRFRAIGLGITIDNVAPAIVVPVTPTSSPASVIKPTPSPNIRLQPVETEQSRLLQELENLSTTHERRLDIGKRLDTIGDTRRGVGVFKDGTPDIGWFSVALGGSLTLADGETHKVQPFFIAGYVVTYAQYEAFVSASDGYNNPKWWQGMPQEYQMGRLDEQNNKGNNNPRENISWYQSVAYSRWVNQRLQGMELEWPNGEVAGKLIVGRNGEVRLPLDWEWQWAAQDGPAQRTYAWGDWQEGYANTDEAGLRQTTAVGMYPQGRAACGAYDMSGNVWEWCLNTYSKGVDYIAVRGGSFSYFQPLAACTFRYVIHPNYCSSGFGFRLVLASPITPSEYL
jgi:formylglycine-generating enzyme required for sulfatase activity